LAEAVGIAQQVAGGLARAHAKGIVHRDVKPDNILLDKDGRPFVADFGIARIEAAARTQQTSQTTATPSYMSPEQAEGKPVDARTDIFSFGSVLYEMVTGQRAFRGESRASTLAAVVEQMIWVKALSTRP
jgi:serine/threonine protein kinase